MKKVIKIPLVLLPLMGVLGGCGPSIDYDVRNIDVISFEGNNKGEATCRFYNDLPTIPYIDINSYYNFLLDKDVEISKVQNDTYLVKTYLGEATINVKDDILHSEDYNQFINTTFYRSGDSRNVYYDGLPMLKPAELHSDKNPVEKTIDFSEYKIDFKYDNGKIWAPLITFSDMFKGVTMIQTFYNGDKIYLVDSNSPSNPYFYTREYYTSITDTFYKGGVRDEKVAELSYYEMCFTVDHYYGYPGRTPIESSIKENGLDYTLDNFSDSTRMTKQYLLSTDVEEYIAGILMLDNLFDDGGHSVIFSGARLFTETNAFKEKFSYQKILEEYENSGYVELPEREMIDYIELQRVRREATNGKTTAYKGDTYLFCFDSFNMDVSKWNAYLNGQTQILPNDAIGNFFRALEEAESIPGIKNFVIDLSINGGGFGDVVMYMMAVLTGSASMYFYDHIDERHIRQDYLADINLDGKFDELDKVPPYDFNFGFLCSDISFSCANLLPALAKDAGIALLGQKTGGGACAVLDNCSMEGLYYRLSSYVHLNDTKFNSIDAGVDVHYDLFTTEDGISFDNVYNLDLLSENMNEFYSK